MYVITVFIYNQSCSVKTQTADIKNLAFKTQT